MIFQSPYYSTHASRIGMHLYTPRPSLLSGLQKKLSQCNLIHSSWRPIFNEPQLDPGFTWKRLSKYKHRRLLTRTAITSSDTILDRLESLLSLSTNRRQLTKKIKLCQKLTTNIVSIKEFCYQYYIN